MLKNQVKTKKIKKGVLLSCKRTLLVTKGATHMEKYIVRLEKDERENLLSLIKKGKSSAKKLTHARILLETDENNNDQHSDETIAKLLHVSSKTVSRIRKAFIEHGIDGALERKIHSAKRPLKIQGKEEAHLIAICCSTPPEGRCRWTLQLLADKLVTMELVESVSPQTVGRTLKKTNLSLGKKKNGVSQKPVQNLSAKWKMY